MAFKAAKKGFSINLSSSVAQALEGIKSVRVTEQARKGAEFQKAVAGGMTYAAQTDLLKKMIEAEKSSPLTDKEYIDELEINLANTGKMARFEKIRDKYTEALDEYVGNKGSLQSYIDVLQSSMNEPGVDDKMKDELRGLLSDARGRQAENELNAIDNRAMLAEKDHSQVLLDKSIKEIKDRKAIAGLNGNEEEVAKWDQTLLALNSSKSKLQIEDGLNDITFKINRNNPKASDKLGYMNEEIGKSGNTGPVTYDGVTYDSMKSFWENERDAYIGGTGASKMGGSYFDEVQKEMDTETAKIAATNAYGQVPVARIQAISMAYTNLQSKEEFASFIDKIEQAKIASVNELTTQLSSSLYDEFQSKVQAGDINEFNYNDELGKVENQVVNMENTFGVKLTRLATQKEIAAGQGVAPTVDKGMEELPVKSAFEPANAAEEKRAKEVYLNADKLAGTGKYVGKTADQVREEAHNYAAAIRKGTINLTPATPDVGADGIKPDNASELKRASDVWANADTLAGTGKYVGQTAQQIRDAAHHYANSLRPQNMPAPAVAPATPKVSAPTTPTAPVATPKKDKTMTLTPQVPTTGVVYNGKTYKDQAAVDRLKRQEQTGSTGF